MNKVKELIREGFNTEIVYDDKSLTTLIISCGNQIKTNFS